MQRPLPDLGEWPPLEWEQWKDTGETLHMYVQIVGKARLGLTPIQNHWWNIAFYLTARGLTTSAMPADAGMLPFCAFIPNDGVNNDVCRHRRDGPPRTTRCRSAGHKNAGEPDSRAGTRS